MAIPVAHGRDFLVQLEVLAYSLDEVMKWRVNGIEMVHIHA